MIVNPGIRRFLGSAIQRLFNSASFYAPLTHTLALERGTGSPTFTRASTATVTNNDGYLVTALAGEARFVGARRVRNLLTFTEDFSNAVWDKYQCTAPVNVVVGPTGRVTNTLTADANGGQHAVRQNVTVISGNTIIWSVYVKAGTASWVRLQCVSLANANCFFNISSGAVGTAVGCTGTIEDAGGGWYRCSIKGTTSATSGFNQVELADGDNDVNSVVSSGLTAYIGGAQLEDVTAQTTQTAGEYVSVGVESAPYYHGSFVDGVECFPTDLAGNPIPAATLIGYQAEGARTNLCLQSNAFNTTWIENGGTLTCTQNATGPDGGTTAWMMTDDNASAIEGRAQAITLTAAAHTFSVFVKKTSGATTFPAISALVGAVFAGATIDTNNGTATVWASFDALTPASGMSARCYSHNTDFWRAELTFTGTAAAWTFIVCPAEASTGTQSAFTGAGAAAVTGSAVFYGAQVELGSFASSYIPTTTVAVARNADVLTYSSAGNIDGTKGWCYAEVTSSAPNSDQVIYLAGTGAGGYVAYHDSDGALKLFDAAAARSLIAEPHPVSIPTNFAVSWGGSSSQGYVNGAVGSAQGFDGDISLVGADLGVGSNAAGVGQIFGTIRNVRIGQRQLSASEMQAITA